MSGYAKKAPERVNQIECIVCRGMRGRLPEEPLFFYSFSPCSLHPFFSRQRHVWKNYGLLLILLHDHC